jgi:membrane-associated protease RseP (regulator of RpoE activity)
MGMRVAVLAALALLALPAAARAQAPGDATVVPIQVTGPPDQRLNLLVMGDGYQAGGCRSLDGAHVTGAVEVRSGGSLVAINGAKIDGWLKSAGAGALQLIGATVLGSTDVSGTTGDTTITGAKLDGGLKLAGNAGTVKLAGNRIYRELDCGGAVDDFGAPNALGGPKSGTCAALTTTGVLVETPVQGSAGGSVPATLSLTLGPNASFGSFVAGKAGDYSAMTAANVISTAGNASLTVSIDQAHPPHLTNGAFALPEAMQVEIAPNSWSGPVSNGASTITFRQHIGANDPLRTGTYSKTLTFTLSTTAP